MATCTKPSSPIPTYPASFSHSRDRIPSLCCFNHKPLFRAFSPCSMILKSKEAMWINANLRQQAMSRPYDSILGAFSIGNGKVARNDEEVEDGDGSTTDTVTTSKAKKGKTKLPVKKEGRRTTEYIEIQKLRELTRKYDLKTAISLLKDTANTKFVDTVQAHFHLNINPKYYDQMLRATVSLPHGIGKFVKVVALVQGEKVEEAKNAGADLVGGEELMEQIKGGFMEFDKLIATPDMLAKIASLDTILGPRGLMPNSEDGTVTTNISQAIGEFKRARVEYRVDKTGFVHLIFGKIAFSVEELMENFIAVLKSIEENKPPGAKCVYWRSAHVSTEVGLSVKLNLREMLELYLHY